MKRRVYPQDPTQQFNQPLAQPTPSNPASAPSQPSSFGNYNPSQNPNFQPIHAVQSGQYINPTNQNQQPSQQPYSAPVTSPQFNSNYGYTNPVPPPQQYPVNPTPPTTYPYAPNLQANPVASPVNPVTAPSVNQPSAVPPPVNTGSFSPPPTDAAPSSPTSAHQAGSKRRVYPVDEEGLTPYNPYESYGQQQQQPLNTAMAGMSLNDGRGNAPYQQGVVYPPHQQGTLGHAPQPPQQGVPYPQQQGTGYPPQPQQGAPYPPQQQGAYPPQHQQPQPAETATAQASGHTLLPTAANQCPTKYLRMTINAMPASQSLLSKVGIPFGCILDPLASAADTDKVPLVSAGSSGIVRCRRCRAYINPFVTFLDSGRRWRCNLCDLPNEVPSEYYSHVNPSTGLRDDIADRPELQRGCVEFVAPAEYMVRPPQPPIYFFLIDVCYASISSGMFQTLVNAIKQSLDELPGDSRTQVGFITFDKNVHFYNLKASASQPQMLVVTDIENIFVPLVDDLLVNLREARHLVDNLLDKFPAMFANTQQVESALGPALKAAFNVIKHIGGKVLLFQSTMPLLGSGKLVNREDPKMLGTDKESLLLNPVEPVATFYKDFALDCSRQQIAIDLYLFPSAFIDVATLGVLPQITGGELYYYPHFSVEKDGDAFGQDVYHNLTRYTAWEGVIRVRCSRGLKVTAHHGNFFIRSTDLLALPNCDQDKAFACQLALSETLVGVKYSAIQAALLYTNSSGERRIRVFTSCFPVTNNPSDLFKNADTGAIINLITKMAIDKLQTTKISDAREAVVNKCVEILTFYRESFCTANSPLQIPDNLRLLPLLVLAVAKNLLFRPGDVRPDERTFHMYRFKTLSVDSSLDWLYPKLYNLSELTDNVGKTDSNGNVILPPSHSLSSERLDRRFPFLLDNGYNITIYVPKSISPEYLQPLFGVERVDQIAPVLPVLETDVNNRVRYFVATIRGLRNKYVPAHVVREGDKADLNFLLSLIEDRSRNITSYQEFMVQLQRSVTSKSSVK